MVGIEYGYNFNYLTIICYGSQAMFTREFDSLPCFAGKPVTFVSAGLGFLPANSMVCPVSRVSRSHLSLPGSTSYPRMLMTLGFHR